jgi:hypothetical protein
MRIITRTAAGEDWDAFVEQHSSGWFWHSHRWVSYCLAYRPDAQDCSFAVVFDNDVIGAVVPLVREGDAFTMGGHPGAEPLVEACSSSDIAALTVAVDAEVVRLAGLHGVTRWAVRAIPARDDNSAPPTDAWRDISWHTVMMDLFQPHDALWTGVRKSYRSLVRAAQRQYRIVVSAQPWAVAVAHRLHREAAGRETRADATWLQMAEWATDGYVITALAMELPDTVRARGMAMAFRYKDAAYYASGATLDTDLSHALVWTLAETLQQGGLRRFEVGWTERPGDDDKARNIAFFKLGFGSEWRVQAYERSL